MLRIRTPRSPRASSPSPSSNPASAAACRALAVAALLAVPAAASAQLGIDLSAPPPKKEKQEKRKPTPPAPARPQAPAARQELPVLDLGAAAAATGSGKERIEAAKKRLEEGATEAAAIAFDEILREPALAPVHDEARYQLGKALVRLGLNHSALAAFDALLASAAPGSQFHGSAMEWLFYVGRRLENEQPLLARVARHAGAPSPPGSEDRFHFLLAKYEFERGRALADAGRVQEARTAWSEARRRASLVREQAGAAAPEQGRGSAGPDDAPPPDAGDLFAKARFVDGLVLYAQDDQESAIEAFKDVVRITNPKRGRRPDPELRELAFLQLARIHYENRQNRYAIFYYGKMPWGGESWLQGLWEASYAHYRIGDYEKTLGNLLTLQSPYFRDEYYPESHVLKAIVYYENCRYPEARRVLEGFTAGYEPVYDELARMTAGAQPASTWYELVAPGGGRESPLGRKITKLAFTDLNIQRLAQSIEEVDDEVDRGLGRLRGPFRESALAKRLADALAAEKARLVEEAGARTRAKLEWERDQLRALLAQALRIKIEVSRKEREALEGSLAAGSQVEVVRDLKYSTAVSDEHLYWPYQGEFWRDELGTYSYTLTRGCKDRLPASAGAAASR